MKDEIFNDCYNRWLNSVPGTPFWGELAEKYGYENGEKLRTKFKLERYKRGVVSKVVKPSSPASSENYIESFSKNTDGTYTSDKLIELCETENKDDIALLIAHGFDPDKWTILYAKNNMWHALRKNDAGQIIQYQSKITVRPKTVQDLSVADINRFYSQFELNKVAFPVTPKSKSKRVLEIDVADWHIGSRQYFNNDDYLEQCFPRMMGDILERSEGQDFSKIYFVPLGDVFHYDTVYNQTNRNQQIVETNGQTALEMFDVGVSMMTSAIDSLLGIAPVEIPFIPGNHDGLVLYHLIKVIEAQYRGNKNVTVDSEHKDRKFRLIGSNLVGWEHGTTNKKNRFNWLPLEAKKEWGDCKYAEIHFGHLHHQEVEEEGGIVRRRLPAITNTDSWHYKSGFLGAVRSTVSFVWDVEKGLREQWFSSV